MKEKHYRANSSWAQIDEKFHYQSRLNVGDAINFEKRKTLRKKRIFLPDSFVVYMGVPRL